ncbi:MAG: hypothetical protein HN704_10880 [Bacteroidetes bacterium]|jgi:hypothetical protein|nr:hypothetical protein [Bacteroidota bacterium]MBT6688009.1 hypothetical protein [Bacteroidota bacterium]MBT7142902.1 hypothetical protein [Bacteroidota bacterium]MBT7492095.1 hypothetical protein [Bacteroidota bacterium]
METFLEILKYILPSIIVFLTAYFILKAQLDNFEKRSRFELKLENQKIVTPVKLQAYERLILLLERVSPETLIVRVSITGKTNQQLQNELLRNIRAEFEHNLSQQLYVSVKAWEIVINARESIVKQINTFALKVKPNSPAIELSKEILESQINIKHLPARLAIDFLKNEAYKYF